ncbi:hypothetical protein Poli38472_009730 [Pythium oligandrum]|uniref:Peptidase M3A/M3B catalytic domain-containing protein n=1 Tax=Pythium oligandrum TaxID=41045 RepID=A0A8K1FJW8_PYTOL|nr:hypothetical protein Poli38472_009730 [Pythium oligandrum]|eukprot:TMW62237.1 hypothetical protein Poli38472_009730 [Pythium oligandrum]
MRTQLRAALAPSLRSFKRHALGIRCFSGVSGVSEAQEWRRGPPGLFQLPNLTRPQDFGRLTREVKAQCSALKHAVTSSPPGLATIQFISFHTTRFMIEPCLYTLSNAVCSVIDAAELCRNVHPDDTYRHAASVCVTELSDFIQNLNADIDLFNALRTVTENKGLMQSFTEEQRRMAVLLRKEFERDGIHLSHIDRRRVIQLQNEITQLSMEFQRVIHTARDFVEVPAKLIRPLPHSVTSVCERKLLNPSVLRVPTDVHVMNTVLKWVGDSDVRREMYLKGNSCAKENLVILDELREKRHALAQLLGFESFAHFAMSDRMMTSPEEITSFVTSFSSKLKPKATEELQVLINAKKSHEGRSSRDGVAMWDLQYYMGMLKARQYRIDSRVLASYFPLERCLDGLRIVCRELFGLELVSTPMEQHESWHPDVQKLTLKTQRGETLGCIYLDLYPRRHKYNHAAHFTVRCGKRLSPTEYQTPLVALVCNFNKPAPSAPTLLNHSEVETLFHEFGHVMHSMLSRTEFQHFSGTRTAMDFVETPSHLFEYFAWDYRVVREFARHHRTNEPIPREMMESLRQSKHMFSAMDTQTQCLYSLLDLSLFGPQKGASSTTETLKQLQNEHTLVPYVPGTYWHTRFGHLVGYGAGYYSYLYSHVFASDIWTSVFQSDPLNKEAGQRLYQNLMAHGGAKDPNEMLRSLIGKEPTSKSYLEELGIHA